MERDIPDQITSPDGRKPSFTRSDGDEGYSGSLGLGSPTTAEIPTPSTKTAYGGSSNTDHSSSKTGTMPTPSTFHTSPSPSEGSAITTGPPPTALPAAEDSHGSGLTKGELAAAIVVPILAVIALLVLVLLFLRRKSRDTRPRTGSGGSSSFMPVLREKWGSMRSSDSSSGGAPRMSEMNHEPVVTGTQNNAYFTGLDTSSHSGSSQRDGGSSADFAPGRRSEGGTTFVVPPPPYNVNSTGNAMASELPHLEEGSGMEFDLGQFGRDSPAQPQTSHARESESPVSPLHGPVSPLADGLSAADLLAMPLDPPQPSHISARSITSTLYSDTASIHSARAARRSIGPSVIAPVAASSASGNLSAGDPFVDPNTPITPLSVHEAEHQQVE